MKIRINHDPASVYADNQIMDAKELINDFIETLNENAAVDLIKSLWDLSIEVVEEC